jgi:predicted nucleotidyltransferase
LSEPAFDELLRRLAEADVEFVVVGGLAVNAWGVVRGTKDVDIVVAPETENLKRVATVAVACGGHVQQGDDFLGSTAGIASALASGEQVAIETDLGRLDVVQGLDGVPSYADLSSRASEAEILGVSVAICSIQDLKAMKRAAGRTRDLADLEDLNATNDRSEGQNILGPDRN